MTSKKSNPRSEIIRIRDLDQVELDTLSLRMGLALSQGEMSQLRGYFRSIGRDPTDVEIQAMAQAWSEHCCYKSSRFYLKKYLSGLRNESVILAMEDDAGVVEFDGEHAYVVKMESHNHPSALEPYGGAATGVGGIIRDVLCMGAQPIAILDSLYFGDPSFGGDDRGSHSSRFLSGGIVRGIRDYGNRLGIPTVAGSTTFDSSYNRNPLVNAGCIGIVRKDHVIRSRVSAEGEILLLIGGGTGRDGIHGVNFASRSFGHDRAESTRSVQLGNPIVEEPLIHGIIELVDLGIVCGMKDLGGGGLSSAAGEMMYAAGLAGTIELDRVHLKEKDMQPWEIWVSESQERMLVSMDPPDLDKAIGVLKKWDLNYSVIGHVTKGENLKLTYGGETVLDLPLSFLTSGPTYARSYTEKKPDRTIVLPEETRDYNTLLKEFLSSPNVAARFRIIREYDRTVRGSTIISGETGVPGFPTHSDAAVIKPLPDSRRGLVLTSGCRVAMTRADAYAGTLNSFSKAVRNILSMGGIPHSVVDCMNFGDPEQEDVMGDFVSSLRALSDSCRELGLPVVSGNVSLYNRTDETNIHPSPTIMMTGIMEDVERTISQDFKEEGNNVYLLGRMIPNLNGSEYLSYRGYDSPGAPYCDLKELSSEVGVMHKLASTGIIASAHDVSTGGLVTAICEMAFGSGIGGEFDLTNLGGMRSSVKMFSEGGNMILLEVREADREKFLKECMPFEPVLLGKTTGDRIRIDDTGMNLVDCPVSSLFDPWNSGLENIF